MKKINKDEIEYLIIKNNYIQFNKYLGELLTNPTTHQNTLDFLASSQFYSFEKIKTVDHRK